MNAAIRAKVSGESLSLTAEAAGYIGVSGRLANGEATLSFASSGPLGVTVTGDAGSTLIGSTMDDIFDLSGTSGDHIVVTRAGDDRIIDGVGNNTFDGGPGGDTFVFNRTEGVGSGKESDTILNYSAVEDNIEIEIGSVDAVEKTAADEVTITLDDGDRLVVHGAGVTASQIADEVGYFMI
jgi:Ca2+-binding RTX toxin-like protein